MKKELKFELDDKLYDRLLSYCGGDEEALKRFIIKVLTKTISTDSKNLNSSSLDSAGLQDYLKSAHPSRRGYGAKGQGW